MDNKRTIAVLLILVLAFSGCMVALSIRETPQPISESCSLSFDGVDDWVVLGTRDLGFTWTVEMWIKPTIGVGMDFFGVGDWDVDLGVNAAGTLFLATFDVDTDSNYAGYSISDYSGKWLLVTAISRPAGSGWTSQLWVNLEKVDERTYATFNGTRTSTGATMIGFGSSGFFKGEVSECIIWNRTVTSNEIMYTYQNHIPQYLDGLVYCYGFTEGGGSILYDSSRNAYNGAISGASWIWERTYPVEPDYNPYQAFTSNAAAFIFLAVGIAVIIYVIIKVSREEFP